MTDRPSFRRFAGATAVALLASGAAPLANATTAGDVTDGTLDWGVKESFRTYIVSPAAGGEIEVNGASENSDGSFSFGGGTGTLGDGGDLTFSGSVHFTGHDGALDVTISNPGLRIDGSSGSLIADVRSLSQEGEMAEFPGVALADLDLSGLSLDPDGDGMVTASAVPATLSEAGAPAFGGFYEAGESLDPVSFTVRTSGGSAGDDKADDGTGAAGDTADGASDDAGADASGDAGQEAADDAGADASEGTAGVAEDEDALPKTGAPWQLVAVGGLVLVGTGTAFVLFGRRRGMSGAAGE